MGECNSRGGWEEIATIAYYSLKKKHLKNPTQPTVISTRYGGHITANNKEKTQNENPSPFVCKPCIYWDNKSFVLHLLELLTVQEIHEYSPKKWSASQTHDIPKQVCKKTFLPMTKGQQAHRRKNSTGNNAVNLEWGFKPMIQKRNVWLGSGVTELSRKRFQTQWCT